MNVKVPSTIDSKTVIGLISPVFYNGFESGKNIKTITLPDTIQSIGDYAFSGLINITTISGDRQESWMKMVSQNIMVVIVNLMLILQNIHCPLVT